jgi:hypothetical protein
MAAAARAISRIVERTRSLMNTAPITSLEMWDNEFPTF